MTEPQEPYTGYTPPPQRPAEERQDGMAIAAFVLAFFFWPLALVFGHLSLHEAKRAGRQRSGLAVAALVLGYIALSITVLIVAVIIIAVSASPGSAGSA